MGNQHRIPAILGVFWGIFFLLVNITIVSFDIFPNLIGAIICYFALKKMQTYSKYFAAAVKWALLDALWQVLDIIMCLGASMQDAYLWFRVLVGFILMVMLTYDVLCGLAELAERQRLESLSHKLHRCFSLYLIYNALFLIALVIPALTLVAIIGMFAVIIYILRQIWAAYAQLDYTGLPE